MLGRLRALAQFSILGALLAACSAPLPATVPAESTPAPREAGEIRQIRGVVPSPTVIASAPRAESLPAGAPLPTPLAAAAAPLSPDTAGQNAPQSRAGVQLDGPSSAAATASAATAVAQTQNAAATAAALPAQQIVIQNLAFAPSTLTVRPGTRVVWLNRDPVTHQVQGGKFDSGWIQSGRYWASDLELPGRYAFVCSFHPTMRAEIIVSPDDSRPVYLGS